MPSTYEPIATQTLGSTASSVTFSSIPSTYTDLIVVFNSANTNIAYGNIQFNGDTASNYSSTAVFGNGSTTGCNTYGSIAYTSLVSTTNTTATVIQIQNYSNTTTFKTYISKHSNAGTESTAFVGMWRSTSAINSVTVTINTGNFTAGSMFTLYGIKAA